MPACGRAALRLVLRMAITVTDFDTLAHARRLKDAGFDERQAEAAVAMVRFAVTEGVATKADLKAAAVDLRTELKSDISELRTELKGDVSELRTELKADISDLRTELKADISDLKTGIAAIEKRMLFAGIALASVIVALVKLLP